VIAEREQIEPGAVRLIRASQDLRHRPQIGTVPGSRADPEQHVPFWHRWIPSWD
jgi:hypothetical protein